MFLAGRKPDDIARTDFFDRAALALHPTATGCDNQGLPERVRMPSGARTGLERDERPGKAGGLRRTEEGIDTHRAGEPVGGTFAGWLHTAALDVHDDILSARAPDAGCVFSLARKMASFVFGY
jgi:hypothetical protein